MTSPLEAVRAKFPQYADIPDSELADALYAKFYSDMPRSDFNRKLGLETDPAGIGPAQRSLGAEALRKAEFASRGLSDSVLETIGAVPDAIWSGVRALGLPAPEGRATDTLKRGWTALGRTVSAPLNALVPEAMTGPMTGGDKLAYGAGHGVGDAVSIALPAAAVARGAKAGSLAQGVGQAAAAQPATQAVAGAVGGAVGEASDNPLMGAAAALATPFAAAGVTRAISPVRAQLNPEQARLAAAAAREGIELTPAQATGSRPLQTMESVFATLPLTSGPQQAIAGAQRSAFNRAALSRAGIDADRASPEVIDDAFRALGQRFDDLARATTVQVDNRLFGDIDAVARDYGRRLPTDVAPVFQSYVDDLNQMRGALASGQSPQVPGEAFQRIVSGIRARARSAGNNPDLQHALNELADAVDGSMVRSASPEVAEAWRQARREYRNLLTIDKAMAGGTQADRAAGDIPFGALRQAVKQSDPRGFSRGRGDLNELARIGDLLGSARVPNSGTPERSWMTSLMTGGAVGGGGLVAGADPLMMAAGTAGALAAPRALQMLYQSPAMQAYLTNRLAATAGPTVNRALLGSLLAAEEKRRNTGNPPGLLTD